MVDTQRLSALLDRLNEEIAHLRRVAERPLEETRGDPDLMASIKYRFVVAIEICIDVAQHIISSEGLRAPTDFADTFAILGDEDFVPAELVPTLQDMARFRNLLVHAYQRVDDDRVLEILHSRLTDFDTFRSAVARKALE